MKIVQEYLFLLLVSHLTSTGRPDPRNNSRRRNGESNSISAESDAKKVACPKVRFRRRGCTSRYECKEVCTEKKKCKTTYEYKCKDFRRQECKNVWQNQCNGKGKGRRRRSSEKRGRSARRPYWLNTEIIYDTQNYPLPASDIPFASPAQGQVFQFASQPKSRKCWQKVRQCKWKNYKSSCGNIPTKTCEDKLVKDCKKKCSNVYYCNKCPSKKPKPTKAQANKETSWTKTDSKTTSINIQTIKTWSPSHSSSGNFHIYWVSGYSHQAGCGFISH